MTSSKDTNICPHCGEVGKPVTNVTVRHIVKPDKEQQIGEADYHLCENPHCEIGYFNRSENVTIHKDDFKRPIWFKMGADPVYACYCKSITEEEVIQTVIETNLTEMKSIMLFLRGSLGSQCQITNPAGHCCTRAFNEMIRKGLEAKETLLKYAHLSVNSVQVDKAKLGKKSQGCGSSCDETADGGDNGRCAC